VTVDNDLRARAMAAIPAYEQEVALEIAEREAREAQEEAERDAGDAVALKSLLAGRGIEADQQTHRPGRRLLHPALSPCLPGTLGGAPLCLPHLPALYERWRALLRPGGARPNDPGHDRLDVLGLCEQGPLG